MYGKLTTGPNPSGYHVWEADHWTKIPWAIMYEKLTTGSKPHSMGS